MQCLFPALSALRSQIVVTTIASKHLLEFRHRVVEEVLDWIDVNRLMASEVGMQSPWFGFS